MVLLHIVIHAWFVLQDFSCPLPQALLLRRALGHPVLGLLWLHLVEIVKRLIFEGGASMVPMLILIMVVMTLVSIVVTVEVVFIHC